MAVNIKRQKGVFVIEFALVGMIIAMFLVFISDITIKQNMQGHLQRLSYSGVNVIKERTQLYGKSQTIETDQVRQLHDLLRNSLRRTMGGFNDGDFTMFLEQVIFPEDEMTYFSWTRGDVNCQPARPLSQMNELFFETSWQRQATLYRVTLCYETDNWFGSLVNKDYTRVSARSLMIGR